MSARRQILATGVVGDLTSADFTFPGRSQGGGPLRRGLLTVASLGSSASVAIQLKDSTGNYITITTALTADGFQELLLLPGHTYRMLMTQTGGTADIELHW